VLVDRVLAKNAQFVLTKLTVHRFIFTGIVLATKFYEDNIYSNTFYAQVGGIRTKEINSLEVKFLAMLEWKLKVNQQDYELYCYHVRACAPFRA